MDEDWRSSGRCRDEPPEEWLTKNLPPPPLREIQARSMCSGCPVLHDCGRNAVDTKAFGTIRAGLALDETVGISLYEKYNEIRTMLGIPTIENEQYDQSHKIAWPRVCSRCDLVMRPHGQPRELWPRTVSAFNRDLCGQCRKKERKEHQT